MDIESRPNVESHPSPKSDKTETNHWPVSAFVTTLLLGSALVLLLVLWLMTPKRGIIVKADTLSTLALWVAGIGTLSAVFAAMYVFSREQRHTRLTLKNGLESLEVSRQSLALQLESRDMEQAARVAAWISCRIRGERSDPLWSPVDDRLEQIWTAGQIDLRALVDTDDFGPTEVHSHSPVGPEFNKMLQHFGDSGPANSAWIVLTCQNISNQPIFDVCVEIVSDTVGAVACSFSWAMWSPERPIFHDRVVGYDGEDFVLSLEEAENLCKSWRPRISFTDAASRRWLRTEEGHLLPKNED